MYMEKTKIYFDDSYKKITFAHAKRKMAPWLNCIEHLTTDQKVTG